MINHDSIRRSLQQYRLQADNEILDPLSFHEFLSAHIDDLKIPEFSERISGIHRVITGNLSHSECLDKIEEITKQIQGVSIGRPVETSSLDSQAPVKKVKSTASDGPLNSSSSPCPSSFSRRIRPVDLMGKMSDLLDLIPEGENTVEKCIERNKVEFEALEDPIDNWGTNLDDFTALPENWQYLLRLLETIEDLYYKIWPLLILCTYVKQSYDQNPENLLENLSKLSSIINKRYAEVLGEGAKEIVTSGFSSCHKEIRRQALLGLMAFGIDPALMIEHCNTARQWTDADTLWIRGIPLGGLPPAEALEYSSKRIEIEKKIKEMKREKSSHIWKCKRVVKSEAGWIYGFEIRKEFLEPTELARKNKEIYPALEATPNYVSSFMSRPRSVAVSDALKRLGYSSTVGGEFIWLPDIETLRSRMKILGCDILIASSSGIAGDEEFSRAHRTSHLLLSSGKEFIHDHLLHLLAAFNKYFEMSSESKIEYRVIREWMLLHIERTINEIEEIQKLIGKLEWKDSVLKQKHVDLFWAALSGWIDVETNHWFDIVYATTRPDQLIQSSLEDMVNNFQLNFNQHFGSETKEKYGPLEDKDFEELQGLRAAYCDGLDKAPPSSPKER